MDQERENIERRRPWFRYSLRTLLLLMLLVAVYLGGRASMRTCLGFPSALEGKWELNLPAGFMHPAKLSHLHDNRFLLETRGVFRGVYEWRDEQLVVVQPSDPRMQGLVWSWNGEQLTLVAEPPGRPTGASYVGAFLKKEKTTSAEQQ